MDILKDEDTVRVTSALLSFVAILHALRQLYINETSLAEDFGARPKIDFLKEFENKFTTDYAAEADKIGLKRNRITFEALMRMEWPEEVLNTSFSELPKRYAFNPWRGLIRIAARETTIHGEE